MAKRNSSGFYLINSKKYPSVTTILKIIDKGIGFQKWLASKSSKESKDIMEEAATFGTRVHNVLESIGKGEKINLKTLDKKTRRCIEAFIIWVKKNKVQFLETEHSVYNDKDIYAGTLDGKVRMKDEDGNWITAILDYKTSARIYDTYDLQVAAYVRADEKMTGKIIDRAYILRFEKNDDKKKDMEVHEVKDIDNSYSLFLNALEIWKWRNGIR